MLPIRSFLVLVVVLLLIRFYIFEVTVVASDSMMPTLARGDYVLINKFTYGIENPFSQKKLFTGSEPERGEMVVFRLPSNPSKYYVKRIIGLPGDLITYEKNILIINGQAIETVFSGQMQYQKDNNITVSINKYFEHLGSVPYEILDASHSMHAKNSVWEVPGEQYFLLGDNRDDSQDSRFVGFIPFDDLIGEAVVLSFFD